MKPIEKKKVYCKYCGRKIIAWRENAHKDFKNRQAHKTCWKRHQHYLPSTSSLHKGLRS